MHACMFYNNYIEVALLPYNSVYFSAEPVADLGFLKRGFQGSEQVKDLPKKRSSLLRNSEHAH